MSADKKRLFGLFVVLAVVAVVSFWPKGGSDATVPTSSSPRDTREKTQTVDPTDIPAISLAPDAHGGGVKTIIRNPFVFYNSPTPTPPPPPPTPTPMGEYVGPSPATPTPTITPIIPPRIPYTAIGIMGPRDRQIVVLEEGTRQILAREGDVLDGKFKVQKINRESIDFTFPNLPKEITTRLPVTPEGR